MNILLKNIKQLIGISQNYYLLILLYFIFSIFACKPDVEMYYDKPADELRTHLVYKETYKRSRETLLDSTFDDSYDFYVKNGEGSIQSLILASDYQFRFTTFSDIKDRNWHEQELAIYDATEHHFQDLYGEDFWNKLNQECTQLDKKYKVTYLKERIPELLKRSYRYTLGKDSIEVGRLQTSVLNEYPFLVRISDYNRDYFDLVQNRNEYTFIATKPDYHHPTRKELPTIRLQVFWDTTKTDFPYAKYPLRTVYLDKE